MKTSFLTLALVGILAAGCSKDEQVGQTRTTSAPVWTANVSGGDRAFMAKVARENMLHIQLGSEVAGRETPADVKAFGARMVDQNGKANATLSSIASKKGVVLPTTLDEEHERSFREIADVEDPKIERAYVKQMVLELEEEVKTFEDAIPGLEDQELRAWAENMLPRLKAQLAEAKTLDGKTAKGPRARSLGP